MNLAEMPLTASSVSHLIPIGSRPTTSAPPHRSVQVAGKNEKTGETTDKCLQKQASGAWVEVCEDWQNKHFRGPAGTIGKICRAASVHHSRQTIQQAPLSTKKTHKGFGQSLDFAVIRIRLAAAGDCGRDAAFAFSASGTAPAFAERRGTDV
jgi:hypothetical protein